MEPAEQTPAEDMLFDSMHSGHEDTASASDAARSGDDPSCRKDLQHNALNDVSMAEHANTEGAARASETPSAEAGANAQPRHTSDEERTSVARRESSVEHDPATAHWDAVSDAGTRPADEDRLQDESLSVGIRPAEGEGSGPQELQDRRALQRIVDLRYLSTQQLRDAVFRGTDLSLIRRWIRRLAVNGWVTLWSPPVRKGSAPQYAIPTAKALRWALAEKLRASAGTELEPLARLTIPTVDRTPMRKNADGMPPFFAHQRGVNDMLIAFDRPTVSTLWSASWDRPLPKMMGSFTPPQPDAILVVRHRSGLKHLLFFEHDRGTEKARDFARTKRGYARMTLTPELVQRTFGVNSFQVLVTVDCTNAERRIENLRNATRAAQYPAELVAFYDAAVVYASRTARNSTVANVAPSRASRSQGRSLAPRYP